MPQIKIITPPAKDGGPALGWGTKILMEDGTPLPLTVTGISIRISVDQPVSATLDMIAVQAEVDAEASVSFECPCCEKKVKLLLEQVLK